MTDRLFTKDLVLLDTIKGFHYTDTTNVVADYYNVPMTIRIVHWENVSALNQGLIATALLARFYTFDRDIDSE